ncbi:hypothetical protein ABZ883_04770 [Streptomyces sp. NPDC046977]|uniref:hypothetical protein n=1 Tax=Streptomyces sp. NPDC046977 TaxID=3154703 RepID=UPI0033ED4BB4
MTARLVIYRYVCPWCEEGDMGPDQGRCLHCAGAGLTNDISGWEAEEVTPAPRPPGVMPRACIDCAFRPGSPELEGLAPGPVDDGPFYCHQGLRTGFDGEYRPVATYRPAGAEKDLPVGAMVCAGWWAAQTGAPAPAEPFREVKERRCQPDC